jgi:hypothetical protein
MRPNLPALVLAALTALAGSLLAFASAGPQAIRLIAVPLVLVLPGYAIVAACFPRQSIGGAERLLASLALSLTLTTLGGVVLHWAGVGLRASYWALLLGGVTALAALVALWRVAQTRRVSGQHRDVAARSRLASTARGPWLQQAALLGLAVLLAGGALGLARQDAQEHQGAPFTQLWLLPTISPGLVAAGVLNAEQAPQRYKIELRAGDVFFERWPSVALAPGQRWEELLHVPPGYPVEMQIFLYDQPEVVYRRVQIQ